MKNILKNDIKLESNKNNEDELKIILISDIHLGPNLNTRPGEEANNLLDIFVEKCNKEIHPDLIVELGDRVNNFNHEVDLKSATEVNDKFHKLNYPIIHLLGNHDLHYLSLEENEKLFGKNLKNNVVIKKGHKFISLNSEDPIIEGVGGKISENQLIWLDSELKKDNLPVILLCHHAIDNQDISENPHFIQFPTFAFAENKKSIRKTINNFSNIKLFINGHVHWISAYFNKYPYISIPSFIEAWPENSDAPGIYSKIIIKKNFIESTFYSLHPERVIAKFTWN